MILYDAIVIVVVVAFISRWVLVFVATAYVVRVIMIFVVLRSILFSLMFIFFSANEICSFIVNVESKTFTRWRSDSDLKTSISSIDLSRRKLLISLMMCSLRFFKKSSFNVVRILVRTSRRLMSDDITSIRAKDLCVSLR